MYGIIAGLTVFWAVFFIFTFFAFPGIFTGVLAVMFTINAFRMFFSFDADEDEIYDYGGYGINSK